MIYFLSRPDGAIKIGRARNVPARMAGLQSEYRLDLALLGVVSEDQFHEHALHRRFHATRLDGEWFEPGAELLGFIAVHARALPVVPCRDDVLTRLDRTVAVKAKYVAGTRKIPLGEYLTEITRATVERDFDRLTKPKGGGS